MSTKMISLNLTGDQIAAIEGTLGQLEDQLQGLISLSIDARHRATKMGPKSEAFCRQTIGALTLYPQVLPPNITVSIGDAQSDLAQLDRLRPILQRLHHLSERSSDTELAIGSDIMVLALKGYRAIKTFGRSEGLETLRRELGGRRFTGGKYPRQARQLPNAA